MASFLDRIRKPATRDTTGKAAPAQTTTAPQRVEPALAPPAQTAPPASVQVDALGIAPAIRRLAELTAYARAETPLSIGIFGAAGSGKSFALSQLLADVQAYAAGAAARTGAPFLGRIVTARVDAAAADPAHAIAAAIHEALHDAGPGGTSYGDWAETAALTSGDPQEAVRDAGERITDLRRRHDAEKQALQEIQSRRARLTENVLYDAAGTRIDSYARSNRSGIESRLQAFGFANGDSVATFKDLVRDYSENGGFFSRARIFLHSLWGFSGQMRLLLTAVVFGALAWLMHQGEAPQAQWLTNMLARLEGEFSGMSAVAAWIRSSTATFGLLKHGALAIAALCVLLNIFRALRFLAPIRRGATLLHSDIDTRRRDLDSLISGQSQRVDDIGREVAAQTARLAEAERRADAARTNAAAVTRSPFAAQSDASDGRARSFIASIAAHMRDRSADAPQRIVVAIDNLDALPQQQAAAFVQQAQNLLGATGFVTIAAVDPQRLKSGTGEGAAAADAIARLFQIPFHVGASHSGDFGGFVKALLGPEKVPAPKAPDASVSALDEPMRPGEAELLANLGPVAGTTPRQIKRFLNAYKLLRSDTALFAPLALAVAIQSGASDDEQAAFDTVLREAPRDAVVAALSLPERIDAGLKAASAAQVSPITVEAMQEARAAAARFADRY